MRLEVFFVRGLRRAQVMEFASTRSVGQGAGASPREAPDVTGLLRCRRAGAQATSEKAATRSTRAIVGDEVCIADARTDAKLAGIKRTRGIRARFPGRQSH